jgi:hypothetical protein
MVLNRNTTKIIPRRGRISGKEKTRKGQPLHISASIQITTTTIVILMVTPNIRVGRNIYR